MKLYELKVEDEGVDEVFAISLVEAPAIESDFFFFQKEEVSFQKADLEKKMLIGPILIPDKKILRVDGEGNPYQVFFTKETVKKLAQNYLMKKYTDNATLEHGEKKIKGVHLVESWIKEGKLDKSNNYGLSLPEGTWVGLFKITDENLWNDFVKTGKVKGFSVEALLEQKLVKGSIAIDLDKEIDELTDAEAEILLEQIRSLINMESYSYPDGVKNNAKRGIELNEKNGNKCATQTGKVRAQQLAKGEPISVQTIKRMYSYLSRAETYYDNADSTSDCGHISYLLWGGKAGLGWSRNKLRELGLLTETETLPSIPNSTYPGESPNKKKETDLAEVGPRGGIRKSPKAPKSDTPNPNPKGEGTAKGDASGKRGAKVSAEDEKTLENKVKEFNEKDSNTKNGRATLGALKSVFQRGLGAYNTSHSPRVSSPSQWAFARVNAFLYLLKNGRPQNPKYDTDFDLLPKGHPKAK